MAVRRFCLAIGLLIVLKGSRVLADEPIDLLKKNGLIKSGKFFVVPSEEKVLQGLFNIQPVINQMEIKFNDWAGIVQNEYEFQSIGDYRLQLNAALNDYNIQLNGMPQRTPQERYAKQVVAQERNTVDVELRQVNYQLALRQKRLVGEIGKERAENAFKQASQSFLEAKGRLWPQVEETMKQYEEINNSDSVLNALRAFNRDTKANLKIGPSDALTKKVKMVIAKERQYSPDTAPQPKKKSRTKRLDEKKKRGK